MKKILGLAAVMLLAMNQISFSAQRNTDADVKRLIKLGKQKQSRPSKTETVTTDFDDDEVTVVPAGGASVSGMSEKTRRKMDDAKAKAEAKAERERLASQRKTEARQLRAQRKNMSDSQMMDVEIQRIKRRVEYRGKRIQVLI